MRVQVEDVLPVEPIKKVVLEFTNEEYKLFKFIMGLNVTIGDEAAKYGYMNGNEFALRIWRSL